MMKTRWWIMIICAVFLASLIPLLLPGRDTPSAQAQIRSGSTVMTVDLRLDQEFSVEAQQGGYNIVTVKDGKIAVTAADCPDQYCVRQGFCNSGEQIVCLPHALVISFPDDSEIDGAAG